MERLILASIGSELHFGSIYIAVADVYSAHPNVLVGQHARPASSGTGDGGHGAPYYFLSPVHHVSATRKSRTVAGTDDKGRWHTEAGKKLVQGSAGVYMSKFSYQEKTSSGATKPGGWLMVEYGIDGWDIVIAKVYRSPRRQATNLPPSWTASSSSTTAVSMSLESFLMTDGAAVDLVESQQAVLAKDYPDFFSNEDGSHGPLQYLAVARQYNVSAAAHGSSQFLAGQYNVSGAAGAAHGAPQFLAGQYNVSTAAHGSSQFLAGQYNVSGAAAAAHGAPQFRQAVVANDDYPDFFNNNNGSHDALQYLAVAGQYNVSGAGAAAHGAPQFQQAVLANDYPDFFNNNNGSHGALQYLAVAEQYNVSGAAASAHGSPQFLAGQYNVSGAAAAAHDAHQFLAGQYNVSGAGAAAHGAPQFQQAVLGNDYPDFNNDNASQEMGTWCTPTPVPSYMASSSTAVTMSLQEIESFLMSDDDAAAPGQVW